MKKVTNWKLLADLNISIKTVEYLKSFGLDVYRISPEIETDEKVAKLAMRENRVVITFDLDFGEIYYFQSVKKIAAIVIRSDDQRSETVNRILLQFLNQTDFTKVKNRLVILYNGHFRLI